MNPHALHVLEFAAALDTVARLASSALGAGAVRALHPDADLGRIRAELADVQDLGVVLAREEGWSMPPIPDARAALRMLRLEGSVLDGLALRDLGVLLLSSRTARRRLFPREGVGPARLASLAEGLLQREAEEAEIGRVIDEHGEVRDEASPELYRVRRSLKTARVRTVERLTSFAAGLPPHLQVPDASVSVREGRYVVPVRREGRGEVGGVVHDESGSGATLFVEPPMAIELMNRLREMEAREGREVHRVLRERTGALRPLHPDLVRSLDALVRLDSLLARARYAAQNGAHTPEMLPAGTEEYAVVDGVHPMLLARGERPVPFGLRMERRERTLLISGPNTGGKTVLLKAIGLISLLAQSGVIPPVGPGTRLPVFRSVFADVGDEQSIEASLSTFSAHLKNLGEALAGADWESLVLADELGSGTDPVEGAALARSILLELTRRSAFTVATTHLGQLKLLAVEDRGVVNASLQFDAERLRPTYRLLKGIPGRSYGLAIARRLGLPDAVLAEADAALPQGERDVAKMLLELEATEERLSDAERALATRLGENEALAAELA
ncbi:MAG: endonuclease MutS2, partial [Gemmatimonadota bacterium]|nr:endonuclease MutS2 [Gemmatimonadota bacterium]